MFYFIFRDHSHISQQPSYEEYFDSSSFPYQTTYVGDDSRQWDSGGQYFYDDGYGLTPIEYENIVNKRRSSIVQLPQVPHKPVRYFEFQSFVVDLESVYRCGRNFIYQITEIRLTDNISSVVYIWSSYIIQTLTSCKSDEPMLQMLISHYYYYRHSAYCDQLLKEGSHEERQLLRSWAVHIHPQPATALKSIVPCRATYTTFV